MMRRTNKSKRTTTLPSSRHSSTLLTRLVQCLSLLAVGVLSLSSSSQKIKSVVVVGGTHGNEYTGVWCIKELEARPEQLEKYDTLQISTLLGNPHAFMENKRFIDSDLNREFSSEKLLLEQEIAPDAVESKRARELNNLLGPKFHSDSAQTDLVVDLHSTTSNMDITLIVPEADLLMARAAAYVMAHCKEFPVRILMHAIPNRNHRPNVGSTARHGFTIEVGPVPQGVLRHDAVEKTQAAMHCLFDYLQKVNTGENVLKELQQTYYKNGLVPCFRSAQAKRPGEMSGKIPWPSSKENPNFPAVVVHKTVQDKDYHLIRKGDPLFVTLEGDIIPYQGSHGEEVYLIFVNEGGYYYASSGTGIGVAVKSEYDLETGTFNECERSSDSHECALE